MNKEREIEDLKEIGRTILRWTIIGLFFGWMVFPLFPGLLFLNDETAAPLWLKIVDSLVFLSWALMYGVVLKKNIEEIPYETVVKNCLKFLFTLFGFLFHGAMFCAIMRALIGGGSWVFYISLFLGAMAIPFIPLPLCIKWCKKCIKKCKRLIKKCKKRVKKQ